MKEVVTKFYESFKSLDAEEMAKLYHDEVSFEDPAFGELKGKEVGNMWRMLLDSQKGKDFKVEFKDVHYDSSSGIGKAQWEAWYNFSKTGRRVHNIIHAEFTFKDGLIYTHKDTFDLWQWSRQALGFSGILLGWTSFFKKKLQSQTNRMLHKYSNSIK